LPDFSKFARLLKILQFEKKNHIFRDYFEIFFQARQAELLSKVMSSTEAAEKHFHGAGTRFIEPKNGVNSLISKCAAFLPADEQSPYTIKPEYDMEMNLMGYYKTDDNSGGSNQKTEHKLVWTTDSNGKRIYRDDRPVMKYYSEPILKGFETLY